MKPFSIARLTLAASSSSVLTLFAVGANAAALDAGAPSSRLLFEEGRYLEFNLQNVRPNVTGTGGYDIGGAPISGDTGNILGSYTTYGVAYKQDLTDRLSFALSFDQPLRGKTGYGAGAAEVGAYYEGTIAEVNSFHFAGTLAYDVTPNVKVWASLRSMQVDGYVALPFIGGYTIDMKSDWGIGYAVGAAYHIPEIALRVSLMYSSGVDETLDTFEMGSVAGTADITVPEQFTLEFQTGVREGTLVFGSVHWSDWASFDLSPAVYSTFGLGPLLSYEKNWTTYTLGVGQVLTDRLTGAFAITYEPKTDRVITTIGPVDGRTVGTALLSYDAAPVTLTGSVSYGKLGGAHNVLMTEFDDSDVLALGLRVGYSF